MRHKVGDIVKIARKSEWYYGNEDSNNPKDVTGKIFKIDSHIRVTWDNGMDNSYLEPDLKLVRRPKSNP